MLRYTETKFKTNQNKNTETLFYLKKGMYINTDKRLHDPTKRM